MLADRREQQAPPISQSSSLSLSFVRLTPRHTDHFCAVKPGRKHAAKRKEKVYNTSLALMKGGWNTVIFYFLNSVSLSLCYLFSVFFICQTFD